MGTGTSKISSLGERGERPAGALAPGASAWTTEVLAPLERQPALPSGELRYTVELGEVVAMGDAVERREAMRRAPQPIVIDVFSLHANLSASSLNRAAHAGTVAKKATLALGEIIGVGKSVIDIPDPTGVQNLR